MREIILFIHPTCGVLATLAAVWIFVEALNGTDRNARRIHAAAWCLLILMVLAWGFGGYWYVVYYGADRAIILRGPWPFAHNLFMETKEHLFFIPLILALYLPIVTTRLTPGQRARPRLIVLAVSGFIVLNALAIEGAGAIINHGAELSLAQTVNAGARQ